MKTLRLVITGAATPLGRAACQRFVHHACRPFDRIDATTIEAVRGSDAILHLASSDTNGCVGITNEQEALRRAMRDTWDLCVAAREHRIDRIVVASSLGIFQAYPDEYLIDEMWRPRPRPIIDDLAPYLCERVVREAVRAGACSGICLRFNPLGNDPEQHTRLEDALLAIEKALLVPLPTPGYRWHVAHVATSKRFLMREARQHLGLTIDRAPGSGRCGSPVRAKPTPAPNLQPGSRPDIRSVCVLGAGGHVGAAMASELCRSYVVRFADIASLDEVRARGFQQWDALPDGRSSWTRVDINDYDSVQAAMAGCDAVINLTVARGDAAAAFDINAIGTYHVMKAAQHLGIKRVIQSGPITRVNGYEGDNRYEYALTSDAPLRPGMQLYEHSKTMGHVISDAFAREAGLDVITLLISRIRKATAFDNRDDNVMMSFCIDWQDLVDAFLCALRAPRMEKPNETFFACAQLPMWQYDVSKEERLLGWKARQTFERFYHRSILDTPDVSIG